MTRCTILLALLSLAVAICARAAADTPVYPIYEIPTDDLPDLRDGTLSDWAAATPGPSVTTNDFGQVLIFEKRALVTDPVDLAVECYLGWHSATQTVWVGVERVDDVYINTYPGGEPQNMWAHDGMDLMVDGDHSGGDYNGFTAAADGGEEMAKLLAGYQAQQYYLLPESPDGNTIYANASASGWVAGLPWADAGGAAWGVAPTTSVMEGHVTPWDQLDWRGSELSSPSVVAAGRVIGFQLSLPDWDVVGYIHGFHTIAGLSNTWRMADNFVDGELIPCERRGCTAAPGYGDDVEADSWARIKASVR